MSSFFDDMRDPKVKNHPWVKRSQQDWAGLDDMFSASTPYNQKYDKDMNSLIRQATTVVQDILAQFDVPMLPEIRFMSHRDAKYARNDKSRVVSATLLFDVNFRTITGMRRNGTIPVSISNSEVIPPSILEMNGRTAIISQSIIDGVLERATSYSLPNIREGYEPLQTGIEREMSVATRNDIGWKPTSTEYKNYMMRKEMKRRRKSEIEPSNGFVDEQMVKEWASGIGLEIEGDPQNDVMDDHGMAVWYTSDVDYVMAQNIRSEGESFLEVIAKDKDHYLIKREKLPIEGDPKWGSKNAQQEEVNYDEVREAVSNVILSGMQRYEEQLLKTDTYVNKENPSSLQDRKYAPRVDASFIDEYNNRVQMWIDTIADASLYNDENTLKADWPGTPISDVDSILSSVLGKGGRTGDTPVVEGLEEDLDNLQETAFEVGLGVAGHSEEEDYEVFDVFNSSKNAQAYESNPVQPLTDALDWATGYGDSSVPSVQPIEELQAESQGNRNLEQLILRDPALTEVIQELWNQSNDIYSFSQLLQNDPSIQEAAGGWPVDWNMLIENLQYNSVITASKTAQGIFDRFKKRPHKLADTGVCAAQGYPDNWSKEDYNYYVEDIAYEMFMESMKRADEADTSWEEESDDVIATMIPDFSEEAVINNSDYYNGNTDYDADYDANEVLNAFVDDLNSKFIYFEKNLGDAEMGLTKSNASLHRRKSMKKKAGMPIPSGYDLVMDDMKQAEKEGKDTFPRAFPHILRNYILEHVATAYKDQWMVPLINDGYCLNPYGTNVRVKKASSWEDLDRIKRAQDMEKDIEMEVDGPIEEVSDSAHYPGTKTPMEISDGVKFNGPGGGTKGTIVEIDEAGEYLILKNKGHEYRVPKDEVEPLPATFKKMYM